MPPRVTGRSLSPMVKRSRDCSRSQRGSLREDVPPNHDAGSGRPVTREDMSHELQHANTNSTAASICTPEACSSTFSMPRARPVFDEDLPADPDEFLACDQALSARTSSSAAECMFAWYWLADLCETRIDPVRPRPRPGHEGGPRRQSHERSARRPDHRRPLEGRRLPARLRLSQSQTRHPTGGEPLLRLDGSAERRGF